jgi:hypothetical protein
MLGSDASGFSIEAGSGDCVAVASRTSSGAPGLRPQ